MTAPARGGLTLIVSVLAAAAWVDLVTSTLLPALSAPHWLTPAYWTAARLAFESRLDVLYDDGAFRAAALSFRTVGDIFTPNAPVTVLPFLPLVTLDEQFPFRELDTGGLDALLHYPRLAGALLLWALLLNRLLARRRAPGLDAGRGAGP